MLVVTRFRVEPGQAGEFLAQAQQALGALAARPGWRSGRVGRATDDATLWVMTTEWDSVGTYRRALSAYEVKLAAVPLLSTALDEPTAFEVVHALGLGAEGLAAPSGLVVDPVGPGERR